MRHLLFKHKLLSVKSFTFMKQWAGHSSWKWQWSGGETERKMKQEQSVYSHEEKGNGSVLNFSKFPHPGYCFLATININVA